MSKNRLALHSVTLLVMALFAFLAISSASKPFVWDNTIPPEKSAKVVFLDFEPKTYNDMNLPEKTRIVILPEGEAEFSGNVFWSNTVYDAARRANVTYRFNAKNAVFSCNLEGGEEYSVWVAPPEKGSDSWGIRLYKEVPNVGYPKSENLVAFILFDPPIRSGS